jgi:hypothetical protein
MPFIHFIKEFHLDPVNATGLTAGSKWGPEMAKRAGEKWRSMSDAEKAVRNLFIIQQTTPFSCLSLTL